MFSHRNFVFFRSSGYNAPTKRTFFADTEKKIDKPKNGYKKKNEEPLWSQNSQKRPLSHRVRTLHAKGDEC
jgi:hypothetical protein